MGEIVVVVVVVLQDDWTRRGWLPVFYLFCTLNVAFVGISIYKYHIWSRVLWATRLNDVFWNFQVSGRDIKYEIVGRRTGDIDSSYADASLAQKELHWSAKRNLVDMCKYSSTVGYLCNTCCKTFLQVDCASFPISGFDTWRWQSQNPNGFRPS